MSNKKTLFSFKKAGINHGSTHEKRVFIQSCGFLAAASIGREAKYRDVIRLVETKIDNKVARRNIRGAIKELDKFYPVEFKGNKQIEKISINNGKLRKILISQSQSKIFKYLYSKSPEIKNYFLNEFEINERQFYRYINGEKEFSDNEKIIKIAAFMSIFLSSDQKFKYYPIFSLGLLENQFGYLFAKTTPLFSVNPTLEEIFGISFIMNEDILIYYFSKISKELGFNGDESYQIIKNLFEDIVKKYQISIDKFLDFFHTMDNYGDFIDPETVARSSNIPIKKRIDLLPKIEKDIFTSMPELFIDYWKESKNCLSKLRIEVSRQIKNRKSSKRDLLNDKLASYLR